MYFKEPYPHFFTATALYWFRLFEDDLLKGIILDSLNYLSDRDKVRVYALVIMPNHIHLIWRITEGIKPSEVQRDLLRFTAHKFKSHLRNQDIRGLGKYRVNAKDREYQFWERNPKSIPILEESMFVRILTYIHRNPLQKRWLLSKSEEEYQYSSAEFYSTGQNNFGFLKDYREFLDFE